jgi:hypothetical protein
MLPKEIESSGVLLGARDSMNADCGAAQGIVATGTATDGDPANCGSADGQSANGTSAHRNKHAYGKSPESKQTDRKTAEREKAARKSSKCEPTGGDVTESEDAAGMSPDLSALPISTNGNRPERQAKEFTRRFTTNAFNEKL